MTKVAVPINNIELRQIIDTLNIAITSGKIQIVDGKLAVTDAATFGAGFFEVDYENKQFLMRDASGNVTILIEA